MSELAVPMAYPTLKAVQLMMGRNGEWASNCLALKNLSSATFQRPLSFLPAANQSSSVHPWTIVHLLSPSMDASPAPRSICGLHGLVQSSVHPWTQIKSLNPPMDSIHAPLHSLMWTTHLQQVSKALKTEPGAASNMLATLSYLRCLHSASQWHWLSSLLYTWIPLNISTHYLNESL